MTTRQEWATGFLDYSGWSASTEKVTALVAQASKENTGSEWNPLATTEPAPNATIYNAAGVRNYPSLDAGYGATLATFHNGHYPQLLGILSDPAGGSAVAYATSPDLNVWGTGNCLAYVEEIKAGDPNGYMARQIAPIGQSPPLPTPSPPPESEDMDNITFIHFAYRFLLYRAPDPGGLESWNNWLNTGGARGEMWALIQNSPEGLAAVAAQRKALGL